MNQGILENQRDKVSHVQIENHDSIANHLALENQCCKVSHIGRLKPVDRSEPSAARQPENLSVNYV